SRSRVAVRRLLVDRHCGRQALDEVDVGLVHLTEELTRVGAQRLDVAALALSEDRVERERRLPRTRQTAEHNEGIARKLKVNALEVVLARTAHHQRVVHRLTLCHSCRTGVRFASRVNAGQRSRDPACSAPDTEHMSLWIIQYTYDSRDDLRERLLDDHQWYLAGLADAGAMIAHGTFDDDESGALLIASAPSADHVD